MNETNAQGPLLAGKVAVVTGANRGIGLAIAKTFVAQGARVLACMRHPEPVALEWAAPLLAAEPDRVQAIALDLADEASIKAAVQAVRVASPRIDVLVNNAGTASGALFQMTTLAELRRVFDVNFFGQVLFSQALSRLMARQGSGSIINITSSAAEIADPGTFAYGASKAALARATLSMATELGAQGVRVNAIAPGVTRTDMLDLMSVDAREKLIGRAAIKRPAEAQDIANMALFLASNLSSFVTGQILKVDGGLT